jgi:peptidyl-prolyl cis-trans isomerase C
MHIELRPLIAIVCLALLSHVVGPSRTLGQSARPASASRSVASPTALSDRTVVARVNDQPIYKADVDRAMVTLTGGRTVEPAQLENFQAATLAQLIAQQLVFDFIKEKGLAASETEIAKQWDAVNAQLKSQNSSLNEFLRSRGLTRNALRSQFANEIGLRKLLAEYGKEEALQSYFKRNAQQFDGTQLRVSHILLRPKGNGNQAEMDAAKAKAAQIKADIEAGKLTFAEAAKQYSGGPSRLEGGDLGFIERDAPMVEAFNAAAFKLDKGQISDPVLTTFGLHLITVTDVKPGKKRLDDVREAVMKSFSQWLVNQLIDQQIKDAKIEFNEAFPHYVPGTRQLVEK